MSKVLMPLAFLGALVALVVLGLKLGLHLFFGVLVPYLAIAVFLGGFASKMIWWAKSPVPFKIPTTCGQQKSLPWIKNNELESPSNNLFVVVRMLIEVFAFRSLFRNTKATLITDEKGRPDVVYGSALWLWIFAMIFHVSFLVVFLRHYRFFVDPVPFFVTVLEAADGFLQLTLPSFYITGALLLVGVILLLARRLVDAKVNYMSLPADYFPLYLIGAIAVSGMTMRYLVRADIAHIKDHIGNLLSFQFSVVEGMPAVFYVHLFLVCVLAMYFPFSKLMHMGGVFLSPTRNMANDSRAKRHINPWNPDIKIRTYAEYENDYRDKMKTVDLPLDKEVNDV